VLCACLHPPKHLSTPPPNFKFLEITLASRQPFADFGEKYGMFSKIYEHKQHCYSLSSNCICKNWPKTIFVELYINIIKIAKMANGMWKEYETTLVQNNSAINKDLLFDADNSHLYVMTTSQVYN